MPRAGFKLVCNVIDLLPILNRKKGITAIMPCFADERDEVRDTAGDALFNLEPAPVAEMIPYLSSDKTAIAGGALTLLPNKGTTTDIPAVEKLLTHPDEELQAAATPCLETIRKRSEAKLKETPRKKAAVSGGSHALCQDSEKFFLACMRGVSGRPSLPKVSSRTRALPAPP
ncbi:MAG: hypothetical protein WC015_09500, partial [Methanoregula sp.]